MSYPEHNPLFCELAGLPLKNVVNRCAADCGAKAMHHHDASIGPCAILALRNSRFAGVLWLEEFAGYERTPEGVALIHGRVYRMCQKARLAQSSQQQITEPFE